MRTRWYSASLRGSEKPQKITWQLLLRVLGYARPYWGHLGGMLVMILFTTGLSLASPLIFRHLIDNVLPSKNITLLAFMALALLAVPILNSAIGVVQRRLNSTVGEGVVYDLRAALFSRIQHMSLRFFTNTKTGEIMSRLNNDVMGAQQAISNTIVNIITNLIQGVGILSVMLTLQWQLTLGGVVILPVFFLVSRLLGKRLRELTQRAMEVNAQMNAHMNETVNIGGALLIKLFGRTLDEENRFRQRAADVRDLGIQRAVYNSTFFAIMGLVSAIGTALVYGLGGFFVITGTFTVGTVVAFSAYLGQLYGVLQGLANAPVDFANSLVSFERVFEVIDLPQEIAEKTNALTLHDVRGELEFDNVTFNYDADDSLFLKNVKRFGNVNVTRALSANSPEAGKQELETTLPWEKRSDEDDINNGASDVASQAREIALSGISFHVSPGHLVALVGPSGSGKTTTSYLIPRLYDPTSGVIRIDGHDLRQVTLDSLQAQIGMVTQDTHLFHDTIRTNLLFARPDATAAELESAARAANIHSFIMGLPERFDTVVGERGYRLSGGEKQRIALARVILKDPRILVLDEATSSLDSESEALIQDALKRVMTGRTSIVIAHRLSTILAADLILVMSRGSIVERGTHEELLALERVYAQLFKTQFNRRAVQ